jgi:hypothetical protein
VVAGLPKQLFAKRLRLLSFGLQRGRKVRAEWSLRELLIRAGLSLVLASVPAAAPAQTATGEVDVTFGISSDETSAAAVQARVFGATRSDWRGYAEISWGNRHGDYATDAFGAAYPYEGRVRAMEVYGEKTFHPGGSLVGFRAGRFRTPFGMSSRSDHAYSGFLRAPLIRYGTNFALSNNFLEAGGEVLVGVPSLFVQATLGVPQDEGAQTRTSGLDTVVRVQGYAAGAILGVSYLRTQPSDRRPFVRGDMNFRGVDARWAYRGVELRGEWIDGRPFDNVATRGGYVDAFVHKPFMGPVTAVARVERLDYDAGIFSKYLKRLTVGARVRIRPWLVGQVNLIREPGGLALGRDNALDVAVTFSRRF